MTKYKLTYFNARGRAEAIRYIFAYVGQPYDDERVEAADWPMLKAETPTGSLPTLQVDDKVICQTTAICRFLGNAFRLTAKSYFEQARLDQVVDFVNEIVLDVSRNRIDDETDETGNERLRQDWIKHQLSKKLQLMVEMANLNQTAFLCGDRPTWADFYVCGALEMFDTDWLEGRLEQINGRLAEHVKRVHALPQISDWLARRPTTPAA